MNGAAALKVVKLGLVLVVVAFCISPQAYCQGRGITFVERNTKASLRELVNSVGGSWPAEETNRDTNVVLQVRQFVFDTSHWLRLYGESENGVPADAVYSTNEVFSYAEVMKRECQVDVRAGGRTLVITDGKGILMVRGTKEELERVEKFLAEFGKSAKASEVARGRMVRKLMALKVSNVGFKNVRMAEVAERLRVLSKELDPEHVGIDFKVAGQNGEELVNLEPVAGMNMYAFLDAIAQGAGSPLRFKVEDNSVVFFRSDADPFLRIRSFNIDSNTMIERLLPGKDPQDVTTGLWKEAFIQFFQKEFAVDLTAAGKWHSFSAGPTGIRLRATEDDLMVIGAWLEMLREGGAK
jgi:hypothetical protein